MNRPTCVLRCLLNYLSAALTLSESTTGAEKSLSCLEMATFIYVYVKFSVSHCVLSVVMSPTGSSIEKYDENMRPHLYFNISTAPATDEGDVQDEYAHAVDRWCEFHDLLEEKNLNCISPKLCGAMLWAHLRSRAGACTTDALL